MKIKTKDICLTGIGIALFVTLSMMLRVPVFENYYLCLGYVVMAVFCYSVGITSGTIVGVVGTILYCLLINGLRGMPGWALGNIVIGILLGLNIKGLKKIKHKWLQNIIYVIAVIGSTCLGILVVKSFTEVILYAQPFLIRVGSNWNAFVADVVVLLASLPICRLTDRHIQTIIGRKRNN